MNQITELFTEHNRKIATGISVVLVVIMSLSVANTVLFVMENMNPPSVIPISSPATQNESSNRTFKVSNMELFGKAEERGTVQEVIDAPETKLNLELQGVFIAEDDSRSAAIVGTKKKAGELYEIGDKLPGNAELAAVFEDHVLLRRGARMEKLLFSDNKFRTVVADNANTSSSTQSKPAGVPDAKKADLQRIRDRLRNNRPANGELESQSDPSSATRTKLTEYRDKLRNDPQGALGELGVTPVSDGDAQGYRIGSEAQSTIKQAGLQPGDIVLSINGRPVGVATNDSALMDQVMASSRVRVEVQRGSRRFFLTVPVPK
ncbi:MAG: PDZ domain-containing protein [Pseudomonadales bacterium]|nr:PDZ domain-containing protein [Pseudomonadales bacterium]MBO6564658.1 PDZ domain-containing protein [Pseudomonadales bacterium]MBO6596287.1 PDZ domain-containing protein [Pseudomonadales bacterium]MBO6656632.1 PDZ domain-containing protein [Pseudomonadales bacterium]MBO6702898.1 PDZ domain-containing protein [Pseudomonadales bacterium]